MREIFMSDAVFWSSSASAMERRRGGSSDARLSARPDETLKKVANSANAIVKRSRVSGHFAAPRKRVMNSHRFMTFSCQEKGHAIVELIGDYHAWIWLSVTCFTFRVG
jgi:hypothetical protein